MTSFPHLCRRALILAGLLLAAGLASAAQPPDAVQAALANLRAAVNSASTGADKIADHSLAQLTAMLSVALRDGRVAEAEQYLDALEGSFGPSHPDLAAAAAAVRKAVDEAAARTVGQRDAAIDAIAAETGDKLFAGGKPEEFDALLRKVGGLPPPTPAERGNLDRAQSLRNLITRCQDLSIQAARGSLESSPSALGVVLNDLVQTAGQFPVIPRSRLLAYQESITRQLAERQNAPSPRYEELRAKVAALAENATAAADFDAILAELAKARPADPYRSGSNSAGNQIETLRQFTLKWQDYYSQMEAGNGQAAQGILRNLSMDMSTEAIYPRSKLLARLNGKAPAPSLAVETENPLVPAADLTWANLGNLQHQLEARRTATGSAYDPRVDPLLIPAQRLRAAADQLAVGNNEAALALPRLTPVNNIPGDYAQAFDRLQAELILRALPGYLGTEAAPPAEHETPGAYLDRVIRGGRDRQDWTLVHRSIEIARAVAGPNIRGFERYSDSGYTQFFVGLNQEKAGQWTAAVRSFQAALRATGDGGPTEAIGEHLRALAVAHPKEYETATTTPDTSLPEASAGWPQRLGTRQFGIPPRAGADPAVPPAPSSPAKPEPDKAAASAAAPPPEPKK